MSPSGFLPFVSFLLLAVLPLSRSQAYTEEEELEDIFIGALFERRDSREERALQAAVSKVNSGRLLRGRRLLPLVRTVSAFDSLQVEATLCELASEGVVGVVGPSSEATAHHVQSVCDRLELPHLTARWDPEQRRSSCLVNLYPHPTILAKARPREVFLEAIKEIVEAWNWKGFTVLYDNYESLMKIQGLVKLADDRGYLVAVRQLIFHPEDGYRSVLQDIKYSDETNLVVECSADILEEVLIQAQQVGLMGAQYSYIIPSLDLQTLDLSPFKWGRTNITGLRMVDPQAANQYLSQHSTVGIKQGGGEEEDYGDYEMGATTTQATPSRLNQTTKLDLSSALIHDAVLLLAQALSYFGEVPIRPLYCHQQDSVFKFGYSIVNYMRLSELEGLSGLVKFDHEGFRTEIGLQVMELTVNGFRNKGIWNGTLHLERPSPVRIYPDDGEDLRNVTFVVLLALTHPYNMLKEDSKALSGNDRYEGFGVDLIKELSQMSGFNFTFKEHSDKNSGSPTLHPNGSTTWDGLIGEVLAGRADLAIADITITDERVRDADFTDPFMNLGISILHRKPTKAPPSLFTFMSPFSSEVWAYMMSAYVGVSLLLFVMARVSPYEWTNPYPCIEEPVVLENQFSLNNAFWFTVGSLMQQGSDVAPIASSTRLIASIWWFFTLIMVSSYTAQLASFLTYEDPQPLFRSATELAGLTQIKYGAKWNGSTFNFFRDSKDPTYQKIHRFMKANPDCMQTSNEAGVNRVEREKNYAFFMESTSIEYEVARKCELAQVGGLLDHKGYGIVLRQNSTYRNVLSKHIVKLQEKGKLSVMKDKWWKEKRGGGSCGSGGEPGAASRLSLANTGGVFVVLLGGCLFGVLVAFLEVIWHIHTRDNKVSFRAELIEELKFIVKCSNKAKPVRNPSILESNYSKNSSGSATPN